MTYNISGVRKQTADNKTRKHEEPNSQQVAMRNCSYEELCSRCRYCSTLQRLFNAGIISSSDGKIYDVTSSRVHLTFNFRSEIQNQIQIAKSFDWSSAQRSGERVDKKFILDVAIKTATDIVLSRIFGSRFNTLQMAEIYSMVNNHLVDKGVTKELVQFIETENK